MAITATAQGKTFTFPDGASPEDMGTAIDEYFQGQQPAFEETEQFKKIQTQTPDLAETILSLSPEERANKIEIARANLPQQKLQNLSDNDLLILQTAKERQLSAIYPPDQASRQALLPTNVNRKEMAFEQLQQTNPDLAALIESMSPAEKAAVGFQRGLRKVGRGAAKLVGQDVFRDVNDPSLQALRETSFAAGGGEIAGESAPFAAAGPLTGTVGRGLTATRGGATLVPEVTSTAGRTAIQSGIGAAEGAAIAAGEDRSAGEVALTAGLGGIIGGAAELGATRALGGADQLPRQLVEEGEDLLKRLPSGNQITQAIEEAAPTVDQLFTTSRQIFDEVDKMGVSIKPNAYRGLTSSIRKELEDSGLDAVNTPQAARAMQRLEDLVGQQPSFRQLDQIRETAQVAAGNLQNKKEAMLGSRIIERIDDFLVNADKRFIEGGENIGKELSTARNLWGRARGSELISEAVERARTQASGFENGLRRQLDQILKNRKLSKFFSNEEKAAMRQVVNGTKSANIARFLGRFAMSEGQQTNALGAVLGAGGGATIGSAIAGTGGAGVGAVLVPFVGQVSKNLSQRLTAKNARFADQVVRAGSNANQIAKAYLANTPKAERSAQELSELLMRGDVNLDNASLDIAKEAAEIARRRRQQLGIASTAATGATAVAADEEERP